jgi:hypothetical protein
MSTGDHALHGHGASHITLFVHVVSVVAVVRGWWVSPCNQVELIAAYVGEGRPPGAALFELANLSGPRLSSGSLSASKSVPIKSGCGELRTGPTTATWQNQQMLRWRNTASITLTLLALGSTITVFGVNPPAASAGTPRAAIRTSDSGPGSYGCTFNVDTQAFTGAYGTASEIGWKGNYQGVVTCLGGAFYVQDGINQNFGFGIYTGNPTTWTDADGYLPAQVTTFRRSGATVSITEFADRVVIGSRAYVAVYSRVAVQNSTGRAIGANPQASSGLVPLNAAPYTVNSHASVVHDYVVAVDRFGSDYSWPRPQALAAAGSFDQHYAHMRAFWNGELKGVAGISVPDRALDDAYRSGFIYTQIARSGNALNTGVNGYGSEFSHDVVGILVNLFTQGDFSDARALLLEARNVVGSQGQYVDGTWTYPWPWAIYLMKTGDLTFIKQNFSSEGVMGVAQPSIEDTAHAIAADRTGPSGIMESTLDIDFEGYWTTDNYEALLGLAAYRYLANRIGDHSEVAWATQQYDSLLSATNETLDATINRYSLDYLPCSMLEPNSANTCANPEDANWTSPFGRWAWDGYLFGATLDGPGISMIDATYAHGFQGLKGALPPNTFGGFPVDYYYSTAYNAGNGSPGLASKAYRDQGILSYEFMIANSQSGPFSWWESSTAPSASTPWIGSHPAAGQGSSPHAWGISQANKVLLDSLVAQRSDGALIVGRGVPSQWIGNGSPISVTNFPTTNGRRLGLQISSSHHSVSLVLSGQMPSGQIVFQLPAFIKNIGATSSGRVDEETGTVTLTSRTRSVTVRLRGARP